MLSGTTPAQYTSWLKAVRRRGEGAVVLLTFRPILKFAGWVR